MRLPPANSIPIVSSWFPPLRDSWPQCWTISFIDLQTDYQKGRVRHWRPQIHVHIVFHDWSASSPQPSFLLNDHRMARMPASELGCCTLFPGNAECSSWRGHVRKMCSAATVVLKGWKALIVPLILGIYQECEVAKLKVGTAQSYGRCSISQARRRAQQPKCSYTVITTPLKL